jgi:hypothetical protein
MSEMQWFKATFFGFIEFSHDIFSTKIDKQDYNQSLEEAIELADPNYYPNLHAVFRVLLTMPLGSVPCERSFSAIRRLKHWSRSTMTEKTSRLAHLSSDRRKERKHLSYNN